MSSYNAMERNASVMLVCDPKIMLNPTDLCTHKTYTVPLFRHFGNAGPGLVFLGTGNAGMDLHV